MADEREVFSILEDGTGVGSAPSKKSEGDVAAGTVAVPGLIAKDSSGNLKFLTLDANGKLPVSSDAPGTCLNQNGTVAGVVSTETDVASITGLTISSDHNVVFALGAATKPVLWKIVQIDDATTNVLAEFITGPGQFSFQANELGIDFTSGAAGTQTLKLTGTQLRGPSTDMHGTIKAIEKA